MRNNNRSTHLFEDSDSESSDDDADGKKSLNWSISNWSYSSGFASKLFGVLIFSDADETIKEDDDYTALDKTDEWTWEDCDSIRPLQSRTVVKNVIEEANKGNLKDFHAHFLKGFVVPDKTPETENADDEVRNIPAFQFHFLTQDNLYLNNLLAWRRRKEHLVQVRHTRPRSAGIRVCKPNQFRPRNLASSQDVCRGYVAVT